MRVYCQKCTHAVSHHCLLQAQAGADIFAGAIFSVVQIRPLVEYISLHSKKFVEFYGLLHACQTKSRIFYGGTVNQIGIIRYKKLWHKAVI